MAWVETKLVVKRLVEVELVDRKLVAKRLVEVELVDRKLVVNRLVEVAEVLVALIVRRLVMVEVPALTKIPMLVDVGEMALVMPERNSQDWPKGDELPQPPPKVETTPWLFTCKH